MFRFWGGFITDYYKANTMRIKLVLPNEMSNEQKEYFRKRIADPKHKLDEGLFREWGNPKFDGMFFIALETKLDLPIGNIFRQNFPETGVNAAWWIDAFFRKKCYAKEMIDLLAVQLKKEKNYKLGKIKIQGPYSEYSQILLDRLENHLKNCCTKKLDEQKNKRR